jgi:hypothetical protein
VSWRESAEWEVRSRVSPELLAGALAVVLVVVVIGILALGQPDRTKRDRGAPTAAPTASGQGTPTSDVGTGRSIRYMRDGSTSWMPILELSPGGLRCQIPEAPSHGPFTTQSPQTITVS